MKNQPKVSLIVPVYNAEKWLPVSFRSFEGQTYSNTEWVLVDDGSIDGSAALCSKWCSVDSKKRRFVRKTNGGASSARNVGLDAATGDYVLFWDSDDEQDPKAIEKMVRGLPSANGVAVCAIRRVLSDGSWCDIFTCKYHVVEPDAAIGEWLVGGGSLRVPTRSLCQGNCSSITALDSRRV